MIGIIILGVLGITGLVFECWVYVVYSTSLEMNKGGTKISFKIFKELFDNNSWYELSKIWDDTSWTWERGIPSLFNPYHDNQLHASIITFKGKNYKLGLFSFIRAILYVKKHFKEKLLDRPTEKYYLQLIDQVVYASHVHDGLSIYTSQEDRDNRKKLLGY